MSRADTLQAPLESLPERCVELGPVGGHVSLPPVTLSEHAEEFSDEDIDSPDEPIKEPELIFPADEGEMALQAITHRIINPQAFESATAAASDNTKLFFRDVKRYKLLKPDEEITLAQLIETKRAAEKELKAFDEQHIFDDPTLAELRQQQINGDNARTMFINANILLAVSRARKFANKVPNMGVDDLIQEGTLGLVKAVDKYDWRRSNRFSAYATWWIDQSVRRGAADAENTIRLPVHAYENKRKVDAAQHRLERDSEPTFGELALATKLTEQQVADVRTYDHAMTSLNKPIPNTFDGEGNLDDVIIDKNQSDTAIVAVESVVRQHMQQGQHKIFEGLKKREAYIITRHFGLDGEEPATLEDIGNELNGISRERVRQLKEKALKQVHVNLRTMQNASEIL